ncbi:hypothetical protein HHK36_030135 [Tetracentron sinense]|uniref:Uncharacterized protein n=1 Tax=Tetracentron sinense TaxID=13715 RepID=A0A834YAW3_TETSI|nr:hypothetical protein HHK36_030135 [Tetracentron sinense]
MIKLSPTMPAMNTAHFSWCCFDGKLQEIIFHGMYSNNQTVKDADWLLCNSFFDIEPSAYASSNLLPVDPMLPGTRPGQPVGHLWPEDSTCLQWLDQQPNCSVVYVSIGSFTVFEQSQFNALALGLELSGHPFLSEEEKSGGEFIKKPVIRSTVIKWVAKVSGSRVEKDSADQIYNLDIASGQKGAQQIDDGETDDCLNSENYNLLRSDQN